MRKWNRVRFGLCTFVLGMLCLGSAGALYVNADTWVRRPLCSGFPVMLFAVSGNARFVAAGYLDETPVKVWDVALGQEIAELPQRARVNAISLSPTGDELAVGCDDGIVYLWDVRTRTNTKSLGGQNGSIVAVDYSPDGSHILTGADGSKDRIYDLSTREEYYGIEHGKSDQPYSTHPTFSRDGRILLTNNNATNVVAVDIHTRNIIFEKGTQSVVTALAVSLSGNAYAAGDNSGTVYLWNLKSGTEQFSLNLGKEEITTLCFSPDGSLLLARSADALVVLNCSTGAQVFTVRDKVGWPAFSNDGKNILFQSKGCFMKCLDISSGKITSSLGSSPMYHHVVAPDGSYVVAKDDEGIGVWTRRRPENVYGVFALVEFWLLIAFACLFLFSWRRDVHNLRASPSMASGTVLADTGAVVIPQNVAVVAAQEIVPPPTDHERAGKRNLPA